MMQPEGPGEPQRVLIHADINRRDLTPPLGIEQTRRAMELWDPDIEWMGDELTTPCQCRMSQL